MANKIFTPYERLYRDILNISPDKAITYPGDLEHRVDEVLKAVDKHVRTALCKKYFEGECSEEVTAVADIGIEYIRSNPEIWRNELISPFSENDELIRGLSIDMLDMPKNIKYYLNVHGIVTVGDLMETTQDELRHIDQMDNPHRVNAVMSALNSINVKLKECKYTMFGMVEKISDLPGVSEEQKILAICSNDLEVAQSIEISANDKGRISSTISNVLSIKEHDILSLKLDGYTELEIAAKQGMMGCAVKTVLIRAIKKLHSPAIKKYITGSKDSRDLGKKSYDDPIEDLNLSNATTNLLKREGLIKVGDIANMTLSEFVRIDNLGPKRYTEILFAIKERE